MRIDFLNANPSGRNDSVPSVNIGESIVAYDGEKLNTIEIKLIGPRNKLPAFVLSQLTDAISAMKSAGFKQCYVMRGYNQDEIYCCWTAEKNACGPVH